MVLGTALAGAVAAASGCGRATQARHRILGAEDEKAADVLGDCIWRHGGVYAWADTKSIRADTEFIEHTPQGDVASRQTWLLAAADGNVRIEIAPTPQAPAPRLLLLDGSAIRVFAGSRKVENPEDLAEAAGLTRMVRELLPMPFSLLAPGRRIRDAGAVAGIGGARTWDRLLVSGASKPASAEADRLVVGVRQKTNQVAWIVVRWADPPLGGATYRVVLDEWFTTGGLLLANRWRFFPSDDEGRPTGPERYTVEIKHLELNAPVKWRAFQRP
jgi:hypothetical protein